MNSQRAPLNTRLLGSSDIPKVEATLRRITVELRAVVRDRQIRSIPQRVHGDLAFGMSGAALLFGYLGDLETAEICVSSARELVPRGVGGLGLFSGVLGIGWTLQHLAEALGLDADASLSDLDTSVMWALRHGDWRYRCDLINGLTGVGVYALERRQSSKGFPMAAEILRILRRNRVRTRDGIAWRRTGAGSAWVAPNKPRTWIDLGLARGSAGTIVLLAGLAAAHSTLADESLSLLQDAMRFIRSNLEKQSEVLRCPSAVATRREPIFSRHACWCYGELALAHASMIAFTATGDGMLVELAEQLALGASIRVPATTDLVDAGLCHGTAGMAHAYHRLFRVTKNPVYLKELRLWIRKTSRIQTKPGSTATYTFHLNRTYQPIRGLLRGAAGVGLAMLAMLDPREPEWDRALLMSIATGGSGA